LSSGLVSLGTDLLSLTLRGGYGLVSAVQFGSETLVILALLADGLSELGVFGASLCGVLTG